ncbi:hypothetical protein M758_UG105100 [Ceratodon purpureus]|nr:hypothetical protein M758_UG105100 [Ceratodon purpureus]
MKRLARAKMATKSNDMENATGIQATILTTNNGVQGLDRAPLVKIGVENVSQLKKPRV